MNGFANFLTLKKISKGVCSLLIRLENFSRRV
jgi:hypothetical protein